MFVLGMTFVFLGISLLAPDDSKGWSNVDFSCAFTQTYMTLTLGQFSAADTKDGLSATEESIIDMDKMERCIWRRHKQMVAIPLYLL
jgi:hypothetical protein